MYRRSAVLGVGGYRVDCRHFAGLRSLGFGWAEQGHLFANMPLPLLSYRLHRTSISQCIKNPTKGCRANAPSAARGNSHRPIRGDPCPFTGIQHSYGDPARGRA